MMDARDAIKNLEDLKTDLKAIVLAESGHVRAFKYYNTIPTAINALRKQTPAEVEIENGNYICPLCKNTLSSDGHENYCDNCGQTLDWSCLGETTDGGDCDNTRTRSMGAKMNAQMNAQTVIKTLKRFHDGIQRAYHSGYKAAIEAIPDSEVAIEVLEKQLQVKPVLRVMPPNRAVYVCPKCEAYMLDLNHTTRVKYDYCPECGQRLGWDPL